MKWMRDHCPSGLKLAGFLAAVTFNTAFVPSAAAQPGAPPTATQRFRMVEIIDPSGFERPMPAARIMVPAGWQAQGGVVWNNQAGGCSADATQFKWAAGDPQGVSAVEIMPGTGWQMTSVPSQYPIPGACANASITTVRQFLEAVVQINRPGAAILDYRDRPDLVAELGIRPSNQSSPGLEQRMWTEAGEILIGYRYKSQNVREMIGAAVIFNHMRMGGAMPGDIMEFMSGTSLPAFAMRAPDGALDFRLYETIRKSIKPDPDWQARMNRHNMQIARINAKGAADRARISRNARTSTSTNTDISDIMHEGWKRRQAIVDKGQENWSRGMREQELYNDPGAGEQVELPNTYDHAWRLQDGSYLMTDNPLFNPNVDLGVTGTELQRAQ